MHNVCLEDDQDFVAFGNYFIFQQNKVQGSQILSFEIDRVLDGMAEELRLYKMLLLQEKCKSYDYVCKYNELMMQKDEEIKKINSLAFNDPLTGLYNANYVDVKLRKALRACSGKVMIDKFISITVIDVNNLKAMNDLYGHYHGNRLIEFFASKMRELKTPWDIICRIGGDEFIIISLRKTIAELQRFTSQVRRKLNSQEFDTGDGNCVCVGASVGSSYSRLDAGFSFNKFFIRADKRMYVAKKKKKRPQWVNKSIRPAN